VTPDDPRVQVLEGKLARYEAALLQLIEIQQGAKREDDASLIARLNAWIPELMAEIHQVKRRLAQADQHTPA